jgi:peroxiredoxin family protein
MPKISIIVATEKLDKLYPAMILASTATVSGWEAELFFTFWGLLALRKGYQPSGVSFDYRDYGEKLTDAISSGAIPDWKKMMDQAKATGKLKVYACSTTCDLFGINESNLESFADGIVGAAYFLGKAKNSDMTLFIS